MFKPLPQISEYAILQMTKPLQANVTLEKCKKLVRLRKTQLSLYKFCAQYQIPAVKFSTWLEKFEKNFDRISDDMNFLIHSSNELFDPTLVKGLNEKNFIHVKDSDISNFIFEQEMGGIEDSEDCIFRKVCWKYFEALCFF